MQLYFRSFIVLSCLSTLSAAYAWDYAHYLAEQEGKQIKKHGSSGAYLRKDQAVELADNYKKSKKLTKIGQQNRRNKHFNGRGYGK
ncbi:MAG: hypothetical protein J0H12_03155 [Candidatus Paracaedimonas acanthamoebae]|uniref:DUF4148 domain-containing protein n=1 Tax=Candidatus Paracaedimonas acanthamoebae TaxID=244581 RepID=A0A8J7PIQ0_9PROT|nr:hypothetical protein [Candidatus Paracaedimonas acanthamoebae]